MRTVLVMSVLVPCAVAFGQDEGEPDGPAVDFSVNSLFESRFTADIDSGGDYSIQSFSVGLGVETPLNEDVDVAFRLQYGIDAYDFSMATGLGGDPWDDIHTVGFAVLLSGEIDEKWTLFGGPIAEWSREQGASFSDGFEGGGVIGAVYAHGEKLQIGGGFGVVSQIEDSVRFFPIVRLNWQFRENWRLATAGDGAGRSGFEVIWTPPCEGWEFAVGGAYQRRRFRLDGTGIAPMGVGEHTAIPVWLRATYTVNPNLELSIHGGFAVGNELTIENMSGFRLRQVDTSGGGFVGASLSIRF